MFHGVGDALEDLSDLLNSLVFGEVESSVKAPGEVSVGQGLFAGIGDSVLGVVEVAIEIIQILGQLQDAVAVGRRHGEIQFIIGIRLV